MRAVGMGGRDVRTASRRVSRGGEREAQLRQPGVEQLHEQCGERHALRAYPIDARGGERHDLVDQRDSGMGGVPTWNCPTPGTGSYPGPIANCSRCPNQPQIGCRSRACKSDRA